MIFMSYRFAWMFGEDTFQDGVDISAKVFYKRLVQSEQLPTTSQAPADYMQVYENIMTQHPGSPIISLHISSGLKADVPMPVGGCPGQITDGGSSPEITVVDSKSASYGFGLCWLCMQPGLPLKAKAWMRFSHPLKKWVNSVTLFSCGYFEVFAKRRTDRQSGCRHRHAAEH